MEPVTCLFDTMDHSVPLSDATGVEHNIPYDDDDDDDDDSVVTSSSLSNPSLDILKDNKRKRQRLCCRSSVLDVDTILDDANQLFHIALPCILIQVSQYWIFPVSSSMVGRKLGTVELGGFSLGCLVGNLTCMSIMEGSLSAADTLMPRAYGAKQYAEVGRLAIRATIVGCALLAMPILPLCLYSATLLQTLGQNAEASQLAQDWICWYFVGAPANLVFRVCMRFLLAQQKPWPLVIAAVIPAMFIHPIILHHLVVAMGLVGSALAISITQWCMLILLLLFIWIRPKQFYHAETWPGVSREFLNEAIRIRPTLRFLRLAIGGILSMNEWWFFEIMCFIAGGFGVISLDAHTVAYNLLPLLFMLPLGVSVGLAVKMGHVIAESPPRAKLMAGGCMAFTAVLGSIVSLLLHLFRFQVIGAFTNDKDVLEMALAIWPELCYYLFLIYIFGIHVAILRALGLQWRAASIIMVTLYCFTLPAVIYFAIVRGGGLIAQWKVLPVCYTLMQIALAAGYVFLDWNDHAKKIRYSLIKHHSFRGGDTNDLIPSEATPLVIRQ